MRHSKNTQRGATLTGYALVLSAFTVLSLGAFEGLNDASSAYLNETSDDIAQTRELALYDELEEIPDPTGTGGETGESDDEGSDYELADGGQFQSPSDGLCMTLEADGKFRQRECDGSPEQTISVYTDDETGASQLRIADQCIGLENNSDQNGDDYILQDCDDDNENQLFRRNEADQTWESQSNRSPVMCLDVSSNGGEGNVVHQWRCKTAPEYTENQEWPDPHPYQPPLPDAPNVVVAGEATFEGEIPGGTDFSPGGDFQDTNNVFVFSESVLELESDQTIGGVTIPAGTVVCSYIVWFDPAANNEVSATLDFGAPVLTSAQSTGELTSTGATFGLPGVNYEYNRAWEGSDGFDVSGNTVGITPYAVTNNADMMRVFTQCG